jgi:hypothetical protein
MCPCLRSLPVPLAEPCAVTSSTSMPVRSFVQLEQGAHTEYRAVCMNYCCFARVSIVVCSGHRDYEALADMVNSRNMSHQDTLVLMDDCGCDSSEAWWCEGVNAAVKKVRGCVEALVSATAPP